METWERERERMRWLLRRAPAGADLPTLVEGMRKLGSDLTATQICRRLDELIEINEVELTRRVSGDRVIRRYKLVGAVAEEDAA